MSKIFFATVGRYNLRHSDFSGKNKGLSLTESPFFFHGGESLFFAVTRQPRHDFIRRNRAYDRAIVDDTDRPGVF